MTATGAELLHRITALLERRGDALVRATFGVTYSRALLLRAVAARPGIRQRELAEVLGYTAPAVSSLLKEIRLTGLVTVSESSASKRVNEVFLTAEGAELATEISKLLGRRFDEVLRTAAVDEGELTEMLSRIETALSGRKDSENG